MLDIFVHVSIPDIWVPRTFNVPAATFPEIPTELQTIGQTMEATFFCLIYPFDDVDQNSFVVSFTTENNTLPSDDLTTAPTGTRADEADGDKQINVSSALAAVAVNRDMPNCSIHVSTSSPDDVDSLVTLRTCNARYWNHRDTVAFASKSALVTDPDVKSRREAQEDWATLHE